MRPHNFTKSYPHLRQTLAQTKKCDAVADLGPRHGPVPDPYVPLTVILTIPICRALISALFLMLARGHDSEATTLCACHCLRNPISNVKDGSISVCCRAAL